MSSERVLSRLGVTALVLGLAGAAGFAGCADFSRGEPSPKATADAGAGGAGGQGGGTLSFAADVLPLLMPCKTCHVANGQASQTSLLFTGNTNTDYATVTRFVDTTAPSGSRLLAKASGSGHGGGTVYAAGSPEYDTILNWIEQGAPP